MRRQRRGLAATFAVVVLRPPMIALTRRDWSGQHHIPREGGVVVVANHISLFDPLAVAHFVYEAGRFPHFLGKAEVFDIPVVGRLIRACGQIPVYRESRDAAAAFSAAVTAVRAGSCVIVYPEATITRDPGSWPMMGKTGAARIALTTGCDIVPLAQWGTQRVLALGDPKPRLLPPKTMHIAAGEPVPLDDLRAGQVTGSSLRTATDRIMASVTRLLEGIRGEPAPAQRFDPRGFPGWTGGGR